MGCLFLIIAMLSPRLGIILLWAFTNVVGRAYNTVIIPLLGLIFLPWTTLFYLLVVGATGSMNFGGWLFVGIGLIMDIANYSQSYVNREQITQIYVKDSKD